MKHGDDLLSAKPSGMPFISDTMRGGTRLYMVFILLCLVLGFILFTAKSLPPPGLSSSYERRKVKISELLHAGIVLLSAAGEAVVEHRDVSDQQKQVKGLTKEGKKEFVTMADLKSHVIIKNTLVQHFPGLNVMSEEHDPDKQNGFQQQPVQLGEQLDAEIMDVIVSHTDPTYDLSSVVVWIDPLDATQEYTEMLDQYVTIMMCVVVDGDPIASVIHFPFSKETFWQWANHRASNSFGKILTASQEKVRNGIKRVVVSRSHAGSVNKTLLSVDETITVIPAGGAGYKVFELLRNNADAYVHTTAIKKWDICVGDAFLRHTGGEMRSLQSGRRISYGDPFDYKVTGGFVAVGKKGAGDELFLALQNKLGLT